MEIKQGCLYVVGTPIGNLSDISRRAAHVLEKVDFIAAEDTRNTGLLLSKLSIKNKQTAYHEHNASVKGEEIVKRLIAGESCALVCDAGMPCISDPGEGLVRLCYENELPVYAVPGACAVTSALAVSGMESGRFTFEGFLSVSKKQRKAHLDSLRELPHTLIFYEAPHKLKTTLCDLLEHLGDRQIAVCRELTKLYEEVERGVISEILNAYESKSPRGEYVLVVRGAPKPPKRIKVNKYEKYSNLKEVTHD
jgi:16S rRNA (cytidine1402-2'-O)-methyltransferase